MEENVKKEPDTSEKTYGFNLLVEVLHRKYPWMATEKITNAVDQCMMQIQSPSLREELILSIAQKMDENENNSRPKDVSSENGLPGRGFDKANDSNIENSLMGDGSL